MSKSLQEIIAIKERLEADLMKRPGVTGVDVGYKYVGGKKTDDIAIRVMVQKKKATVPAAEKVPQSLDGVVSDVIERTYFLHEPARNRAKVEDVTLQADTGNYNPVKGGISIGPCRAVGGYVYVGTLGAIVKDNASGNPMLLSNFHVMCIDNGWHAGDTMAQPGRVDGGTCPANVVGTLQRAALTNLVDCAVSSLSGRGYACEITGIGAVAGTSVATLGMAVRKRGRTTGLTYGIVDSVSLSVNIDYGNGIGVKTLTNQIGISPDTAHNAAFGDHGDSGSVVVDGGVHVVGLHFAGSSDGHGIANQIANVLSALNVSLCTGPVKSVLKDAKDLHKEIEKLPVKDHKDLKDHKVEKIEHKDQVKDHKIEKIEHKDVHKELDKTIFDQLPGKGPSEGMPQWPGQPGQPGQPGLPGLPGAPGLSGAGDGGAANKVGDKLKEMLKPESKDIKDKDKNESKDIKDHKPESKENKDHKENKDGKDAKDGKDNPDNKLHKDNKDRKDQPDNKGHKDHKDAKEHKDRKDHKETLKPEIKDHKPELKELEKPPQTEVFQPKVLVENGPPFQGTPPLGDGGIEQRLLQLEAAVASLSTFITAEMRPDLGTGALSNEADR